jgi:cytoskeletal protein RodZ
MTDHHEDNGEPRQESLGNHFQRIRRSQHKTLEEAAAVTRIPVKALAALEADDYDLLPAEVFTRGFIKLYAGYLGLDPAETLKQFINQENVDPDKPADRPYRSDLLDGEAMAHPPAFFKNHRRTLALTLLLAVLIGFYILGTVFKSGENPATEAVTNNEIARTLAGDRTPPLSEISSPVKEPGPPTAQGEEVEKVAPPPAPESSETVAPPATSRERQPATPALPTAAPEPTPKPTPKPAPTPAVSPTVPEARNGGATRKTAASGDKSAPFRPVTVQVATTPVDGADAAVQPEQAQAAPPAATYILEAHFRARSWVHIEIDDEPIREYTSQADVTRVWRAAQRLVLQLDNAEGVILSLNGEPLPLAGKPGELVTLRLPRDQP